MQIKKLLPLALAAVASAQVQNLGAAISSVPELSNLSSTLALAPFSELVANLAATPNCTLLAPSNEAFAKFQSNPEGAAALNDTGLIQAVLQYHVLTGTFFAANVTETPAFIPTILTNESYTNVTGGQVVQAVALDGSVTFFSGLLTNSTVSQADIVYDNGVIHVIDSFLTVPAKVSTTAIAANLTSVAGALTQADLVETVDTLSDVTIFAPSNSAFQSIGSALGNITDEDLANVLTYHVVEGTVGYSSSLTNTSLQTVNGANLTITVIDGSVFVNSAKVIIPDVLVANGVVHVIDNVLNPANATATADPSSPTQVPVFSGASSAADVPFTSGVPQPTAPVPGSGAGSETTTSTSPSVATGAAMPMKTGAVGAAALFGGAALVYNL